MDVPTHMCTEIYYFWYTESWLQYLHYSVKLDPIPRVTHTCLIQNPFANSIYASAVINFRLALYSPSSTVQICKCANRCALIILALEGRSSSRGCRSSRGIIDFSAISLQNFTKLTDFNLDLTFGTIWLPMSISCIGCRKFQNESKIPRELRRHSTWSLLGRLRAFALYWRPLAGCSSPPRTSSTGTSLTGTNNLQEDVNIARMP